MIKFRSIFRSAAAVLLAFSFVAAGIGSGALSVRAAGTEEAEKEKGPSAGIAAVYAADETISIAETTGFLTTAVICIGKDGSYQKYVMYDGRTELYESGNACDLDLTGAVKLAPAGDVTDYLPVPEEYAEKLVITTPEDEVMEDGMICAVYEKASVEAAEKADPDAADGAGWLFSIGTVTEDKLHELLCSDMSNADVFAKDIDGQYYLYYHPSDVRVVREENTYDDETMQHWGELVTWGNSVKESFVRDNDGLFAVTYSNDEPAIALAHAAYSGDAYTVSTLDYGPLEPGDVDAKPFVERLIRNAEYAYSDEEAPDGEYVVLYFPDEDARYDFFKNEGNGSFVRKTDYEGTYSYLYKVTLEDDAETATAIMQEWYDAIAEASGMTGAAQAEAAPAASDPAPAPGPGPAPVPAAPAIPAAPAPAAPAQGTPAPAAPAAPAAAAEITQDEAYAIALEHAGITQDQVSWTKNHLDYENGRKVYEIEFYVGRTEYNYDIDVFTGDILEFSMDND